MKKVLLMIITVVVFNINICAQEFKPNFIIIIADDISWDDFGCYGNAQVKLPILIIWQKMVSGSTILT
jgi:N-sulfoglucosamine sulfohydrolase